MTIISRISNNGNLLLAKELDEYSNIGFEEQFNTLSYTFSGTNVNSNNNGILNLTSTTSDSMINMFNIGHFNPKIYRYFIIRYRVVNKATTNGCEFYFLSNLNESLSETYKVAGYGSFISDGDWHIAVIDCWTCDGWKNASNITGWRFDWSRNTNINMEIDYLRLVKNSPDKLINFSANEQLLIDDFSEAPDCLYFDGINDYITTPMFTITENLTISFWAKFEETLAPHSWIISNRTSTSNGFSIFLLNKTSLCFDFGGSTGRWNTGYVPIMGEWVYITLVRTTSERKLFINGIEYSNTTSVGSVDAVNTSNSIYIGQSLDDNWYKGFLSDVCIWNKTPSQNEILLSMNKTLIGNEEGLLAYWKLDNYANVKVRDYSVGNNNGTAFGTISDYSYNGIININTNGKIKTKGELIEGVTF